MGYILRRLVATLPVMAVVAIVVFLLIQRKWLSSTLLVVGLAGGVALSEGLKATRSSAARPRAKA